ncbi:MAG: putative ABC transporter permease [Oscillospiraceae bacterium]|nr:putative ABC transporter permease [Oscillospiraceae bacterium]
MIKGYDIYSLGIMLALISFLGFLLENLWLAATKGFIDNRNMRLPFLMGYGVLVTGMYLLLGTPENMLLWGDIPVNASKGEKFFIYFLCSFGIVTAGELILGHLMEKLCGFEYWNYERIPLHITKYTSVPTSIGFALIITSFMGACFEPIMGIITLINPKDIKSVSMILIAAMTIDLAANFIKMHKNHGLNVRWTIYIKREPENLFHKA